MASDSDLAAAVAIALIVIVIALCAWPGFARARGRDLAGYWADAEGALFEIVAGPGDRELIAQGSAAPPREGRRGSEAQRGLIAQGSAAPPREGRRGSEVQRGRITGVRSVALGPKKGRLDLGGRRISWKGGGAWARQGVR